MRMLSGLTDLVSGECVLDVGQDALLRGPRQLADPLENLAGLAGRASATFGNGLFAEQLVGGGAENLSKFGEIIRPQSRGASFPPGVSLLGNAELLGDLRLRKPSALADGYQALTELGTF